MERGRPPIFSPEQVAAVAELVKKYKVNGAREILAAAGGPLVVLRPPGFKVMKVSEPTIAAVARKNGVILKQGRPPKKEVA